MNINPINTQTFRGGRLLVTVKEPNLYHVNKSFNVDEIKTIDTSDDAVPKTSIATRNGHSYACIDTSYATIADAYLLLKNTPGNGKIDITK